MSAAPVPRLSDSRVPRARLRPGPMYWFLRWGLRVVIALVLPMHLHVEGRENVPREGGLLVISNHIATADPPLLGALFPRPLHFMAKREWFQNRLIGWLAHEFLCFPVNRHTADRGALRTTLDLLAKGRAVGLYPEGTRAIDARMHPAEAGAGFLARQAGVAVLPVATWGGENILPKGSKFPRIAQAHAHLAFGPPFHLPEGKMSNQEAADYMMSKVAELLPTEYRGEYQARVPVGARRAG